MSEREEGRVKNFFANGKGYGFIRCEDGSDLFAHISAFGFIEPKPGARVSFGRGVNPRTDKPEAKDIAIMSDE